MYPFKAHLGFFVIGMTCVAMLATSCSNNVQTTAAPSTTSPGGTTTLVATPSKESRPEASIQPTVVPAWTPTILHTLTPAIINKENLPALKILTLWRANTIYGLTWIPNSSRFVISVENKGISSLRLYDAATFQEIWSVETAPIYGLSSSPDGGTLVTSSAPFVEGLQFWNTATGQLINTISGTGCMSGNKIVFGPDGHTILSAVSIEKSSNEFGTTLITLWDKAHDTCLGKYAEVNAALASIALSPDGRFFTASFGRGSAEAGLKTYVWRLADKQKVCEFEGTIGAFGPSGNVMAVPNPSANSNLTLWNVETCEVVLIFHKVPYPYGSAVAFSPTGQLIVTGREKIQIWDAANGRLLDETGDVANNYVDSLTFNSGGSLLLSTSPQVHPGDESTLVLWGIGP